VSDDIDIKYRTLNYAEGFTMLEIKIDKEILEKRKTIAGRMLLVKNNEPASIETIGKRERLLLKAEPIR